MAAKKSLCQVLMSNLQNVVMERIKHYKKGNRKGEGMTDLAREKEGIHWSGLTFQILYSLSLSLSLSLSCLLYTSDAADDC